MPAESTCTTSFSAVLRTNSSPIAGQPLWAPSLTVWTVPRFPKAPKLWPKLHWYFRPHETELGVVWEGTQDTPPCGTRSHARSVSFQFLVYAGITTPSAWQATEMARGTRPGTLQLLKQTKMTNASLHHQFDETKDRLTSEKDQQKDLIEPWSHGSAATFGGTKIQLHTQSPSQQVYVLSCDMLKAFEDISRSSTKVRSSPTRFQGVPKVSNSQTKGAQTLGSNKILISLQLDWLFCCMILAQVYWRVRCWRKSHVKKAQGRKTFERKDKFYMKHHETPYFICDVANADNQQSSGTSLSLSSTPLATPVCSHHGKPIHSGYESNRFAMRPTKTWRILQWACYNATHCSNSWNNCAAS